MPVHEAAKFINWKTNLKRSREVEGGQHPRPRTPSAADGPCLATVFFMSARLRGPPASSDGDAPRADDVLRPANRASNDFVDRVKIKMQAVVWIVAAGLLLTRGQVLDAAQDPARSSPLFIYLFLACFALLFTVMLYSVLWVRRVHGSQWPLQVVAPGLVEVATLAGVVALISLMAGLWKEYGLLTPLVVGVLAMGGLFTLHFVPSC